MKKYILSIIALALSMMSAYAQTVSVNDVTIKAGETKVVGINLNNTQTNIVSFQMDLTLPDGITINKAGCTLGSRIADTDQELTIGKQPDGSIRLTSTSFALTPITGTSGEIVKVSLTAAKDAKGGAASVKNIVLATSNSEKLKPANASFKVKVSYILTYKVDGNVYKTVPVEYGSSITSEAAPTKEGHTFSGWSNLPATMPNHNVEVTGTFTINSYTLTYKVDGNVYKTLTVPYASTITPEASPTKEGYTFSGWSEIPKTMPAKDIVVTGSFTINKYKLTYMVDGEVYKTFTLAYGTAITPEASPTKEGYTFSGWSEIPKTMPAHDVVVTGSFSKGQYVLTYIVDGQTYKSIRMDYGNTIVPETAPTKEGYTFSGWSEIPKTMPAHDVVITGSFTINKYKLTYIVDGVVYKTYEINYGTAITPEAVPTKEGYTFSGWSEIPKTMPAHDVTVTGSFSINPHIPDSKPYAVLSENNTVLTFYYDDQMESRGGMDVYYERQWLNHSGDIITAVFDESFAGCTTLTSLSVWFSGCSKLSNIVGLNNLRTDNVTDMYQMFGECSSLTNIDLSGFNTANVSRMDWMFYRCSGLTILDLSTFKTDNVTNMDNMFYGCGKLKRIYVGAEWTTNNVTSGEYMFNGCSKLIGGAGTKYEWGLWDYIYAHIDGGTDNPGYFRDINISYFEPYALLSEDNTVLTFYYDDQMKSRWGMDVYEQQWNSHSGDITTVVFDESFAGCTSLTSTAYWFKDCLKLENIIGIENLRTDNVTDMWYMFSDCSSLASLDLSNFKTDNVTEMDGMFYRCSSLTSLDLSSFKTDNVTNMGWMFYNCENLKRIYVREGWNTSNVKNSNSMFGGCLKLEGGSGTTYNKDRISASYAHVDGGVANPGYLTYKDTHKTLIYMVDGEEYKSYRIEIGKDIIPEPKPTKDGYVFLGWDNIPATMPDYDVVVTGAFYPYGDVNIDKEVNVVDVVDIARFVVGTPSDSFVKILADLNNDGSVNLSDAVVLINDIAGDQNFVKALVTPEITGNDMLTLKYNNGNFSLCLNNELKYTAFQCDIYIPENADVSKIKLNTQHNQKHQLLYNKVEEGHYRVAVLSTSNNEFNDNEGELLNIVMNGVSDDEVSVRDIHFFDVKGIDYLFDDIEGSNTTSLTPSLSEGEGDVIYDLQGRKHSTLKRGVNIVGGNKVIVK